MHAPERGEMNSIEGAKILITGGAGFMGSTTADQLLDHGAAEIRVLDNFVRGSPPQFGTRATHWTASGARR